MSLEPTPAQGQAVSERRSLRSTWGMMADVADAWPRGAGRTWFGDDRSDARLLRASWHADQRIVVLSLWQDDLCTGTFRMPVTDVPRLMHLLVEAVGVAVLRGPDETAAGSSPARSSSWDLARRVIQVARDRLPTAPRR